MLEKKNTVNNIDVELFLLRGIYKNHGYYHVTFKNKKDFFVKTAVPLQETIDTQQAKELLKDVSGIRVIDFQAAYESRQRTPPLGIFVSKWENLPTLENVIGDEKNKENLGQEKIDELLMRLSKVKAILGPSYFDISERNCFFDREKDQLVLFDLSK